MCTFVFRNSDCVFFHSLLSCRRSNVVLANCHFVLPTCLPLSKFIRTRARPLLASTIWFTRTRATLSIRVHTRCLWPQLSCHKASARLSFRTNFDASIMYNVYTIGGLNLSANPILPRIWPEGNKSSPFFGHLSWFLAILIKIEDSYSNSSPARKERS